LCWEICNRCSDHASICSLIRVESKEVSEPLWGARAQLLWARELLRLTVLLDLPLALLRSRVEL
jgi:hypothetical protein